MADKNRRLPDVFPRPAELVDKNRRLPDSFPRPAEMADKNRRLPDSFPRPAELVDKNRRLSDFAEEHAPSISDKRRSPGKEEEEEDNLKRIVGNPRAVMARNERRFPQVRMPRREVSLMSRPSVIALVPELPPDPSDVRAGMTSSARSGYVPGADDSVRRYSPRRDHPYQAPNGIHSSRRWRGRRRRRRGRRRRRRRRPHGGRNRRRRRNYGARGYVWNPPPLPVNGPGSGGTGDSSTPTTSTTNTSGVEHFLGKKLSDRFAEFRLQKVSHVFRKNTQNDEDLGGLAGSEAKEKEKKRGQKRRGRKGKKRRRKGKGRKGRRHERGGERGGAEEEDADLGGRNASDVEAGEPYYYEGIRLFGFLDKPGNETEGA